jgi:organic radical activating enzyme
MNLKKEELKKSKTFCLYPFVHLNYKVDGLTAPCFRSKPVSSSEGNDSGWNSKEWTELRSDLLQGKKNENCKACWDLEDSGVGSYRESTLKEVGSFKNWWDLQDVLNEDFSMKRGPRQLELRFSNKCNLQCRMCGPLFSSKWETEYREIKDDLNELGIKYNRESLGPKLSLLGQKMLKDIVSWKDSLEYIMIAGGEALIQDEHLEFLNIISSNAKNITLEYSSNLSNLTYKGVDYIDEWAKFKALVMKVSIDGDPYIYPYVRKYGKIETVVENISRLKKAKNINIERLLGTITVSAYNIERLIPSIEFLLENGLLVHASQVSEPQILRTQVLPKEIKEKISYDAGVFLEKVDEVLDRYLPNEDILMIENQKKRIIRMVNDSLNFMMAEDREKDFTKFLKYDATLNGGETRLFEYYPHWKNYL